MSATISAVGKYRRAISPEVRVSWIKWYCEDLGETLCPPDWAGMADVTQWVAAESSFALAKGNVEYTVFSRSALN